MNTLSLKSAAQFLNIHPYTLRRRAILGTIPGAKIGRAWVFIEDDLAAYIRKAYACQPSKMQGLTIKEAKLCHCTKEATLSGLGSPLRMEKEYAALLGLKIER